jgi:putative FmdB family regulatory protein
MPTYSYFCDQCKQEFDAFQKITDEAIAACTKCGKFSSQRGVGGGMATFQFKGDGFYLTDYKNPTTSEGDSSSCPCGKKDGPCKS